MRRPDGPKDDWAGIPGWDPISCNVHVIYMTLFQMQSEYIDFYYIQATSNNASWTPGPDTDMDELHPVCLVGPAGTLNVCRL